MSNTRKLTQTAMIAGIYAAITIATFYISFGSVQYRVSEILTILPIFTGTAVPGLAIGCALANLIGFAIGANPLGLIDALFGTSATLIAAVCTYYIGKSNKRWMKVAFAPLPPVLLNAVIVGLELCIIVFSDLSWKTFLINAGLVGLGQLVVCYGMGIPLMFVLWRNDLHKKLFKRDTILS